MIGALDVSDDLVVLGFSSNQRVRAATEEGAELGSLNWASLLITFDGALWTLFDAALDGWKAKLRAYMQVNQNASLFIIGCFYIRIYDYFGERYFHMIKEHYAHEAAVSTLEPTSGSYPTGD